MALSPSKRIVVILLLGAFVGFGLVFGLDLLLSFQDRPPPKVSRAEWLDNYRAFLEDGDLMWAELTLLAYFTDYPEDFAIQLELAGLFTEDGNFGAAEDMFRFVLDNKAALAFHAEARAGLARLQDIEARQLDETDSERAPGAEE